MGRCPRQAPQVHWWGHQPGHRFAITWHEGIQIDQVSSALRHLINHASDDHPAITVTHQDDTMQILFLQQADDILDMGI